MSLQQSQLKISLSQQLTTLVGFRAKQMGVPVTQYVKYLILKDVDTQSHESPHYTSKRTEDKAKKAMQEINSSQTTDDVSSFLETL